MTEVRVVKDDWRDVSLRIERNINDGLKDVAFGVEGQIVSNITSQGLVDTGNYRRSWTTDVGQGTATVGSPVEYGVYLEYGTRFMAAKAHVLPAAVSIAKRAAQILGRLDR